MHLRTKNMMVIIFKWAIHDLSFFIFVFSIQLKVNKCSLKFADDWIRTSEFWCSKWLLCQCQLSHNHCPTGYCFYYKSRKVHFHFSFLKFLKTNLDFWWTLVKGNYSIPKLLSEKVSRFYFESSEILIQYLTT